ncbi:hypothetical protein [Hoeflea prorocentri]|uniref:DUF4231 domain-containing protein n=1 Tax=Hoeflea prorocentri TaxID=1922333 RepID=A0A9X3UH24_9HYPH|nr:hypothetical protein [Hoeflea prorocentri]MCY6380514.1 hypothetical protein [Hoeflea prorocentri]MDA5398314.1 hypothetical protein [Hoeflea prorocentri]
MGNEFDALNQAVVYADKMLDWYETHAYWKMIAFRTTGVVTILATIAITYISASLSEQSQTILGYQKKHLITGLAVLSAITVALPAFFGWQNAWESHRVAQFRIEAAIVEAKIRRAALLGTARRTEMTLEAQHLTQTVRDIVLSETDKFYRGIGKPTGKPQPDD